MRREIFRWFGPGYRNKRCDSLSWPAEKAAPRRESQRLFLYPGPHQRKCGEKFSVGAVQDIEIAVAIRFEEQLSLLAMVAGIDQDGSLRRVVVKEVVRRKLKIPFELSRVGVQGEDTIGIEVVPRARAAIKVRSGIAGAPINCIEFRIVRAGHPGSAAAALVEFAGPA